MKYEVFYVPDSITGEEIEHITWVMDEAGNAKSFPADKSNPDYLAWLETAEGKAYLASQKASK